MSRSIQTLEHSSVLPESSVTVHPTASIGDDVRFFPGCTVERDAVIDPRAIVGALSGTGANSTTIGAGAYIGAGAIIISGVSIGRGARVLPGAVVCESVPPLTIVSGNPARINGYVGLIPSRSVERTPINRQRKLLVVGASLVPVTSVLDPRGSLMALEYSAVPFVPQRSFAVMGVPSEELRGQHAHRKLHQFLICLTGGVSVMIDNGEVQDEVRLDCPNLGLHIPPMVWGVQYRYSADAVLLVLASAPYDDLDYIRDYEDFLDAKSALSSQ